jgi:hypothetical protein
MGCQGIRSDPATDWQFSSLSRLVRVSGLSGLANYLHHKTVVNGKTVFENRIAEGANLPPWLFLVPVLFVALPIFLGWYSGRAVIKHRQTGGRWWKFVVAATAGGDPVPRAWDYVFLSRPGVVVRIRLKEDRGWVGGLFGPNSYAAGYGEEPQDLLLEKAYAMTADGRFAPGQAPGGFRETGSSLLIAFDQAEHIEFFEG